MIIEEPIYYLGWIIQPTSKGFEVYQALDTSKPHSYFFGCICEAYNYIYTVVEGRR